jgi:hypothetical protein
LAVEIEPVTTPPVDIVAFPVIWTRVMMYDIQQSRNYITEFA